MFQIIDFGYKKNYFRISDDCVELDAKGVRNWSYTLIFQIR